MHFLTKYSEKVVIYDLINKFQYKIINKLPKLQLVSLSFNFKKFDAKLLISALASLELLTLNKSVLTKSKVSNVSLKIRKGQPIGCKITLRKHTMNKFLFKILNKLILNKTFKKNTSVNMFSIKLNNMLVFKELEQNYQYFKNLSDLSINIKTTKCTFEEFLFLMVSFKLIK